MGLFKRSTSNQGDNLMSVPMKTIIDCSTGIVSEIPLTDEEIAQREADAARFESERQAKEAEKAQLSAAKQAAQDKLKALGLTDLEVAAIAGV